MLNCQDAYGSSLFSPFHRSFHPHVAHPFGATLQPLSEQVASLMKAMCQEVKLGALEAKAERRAWLFGQAEGDSADQGHGLKALEDEG